MLNLADLTAATLSILPPPFEWCSIPAGKVTIEYSPTDHKTFDVPASVIAKYPITNAQYQIFIDAKHGYSDPRWWDYSDEAQSWHSVKTKPLGLLFPGDDLPRTRIAWYEAIAFTRWLTSRLSPLSTLETRMRLGGEVSTSQKGADTSVPSTQYSVLISLPTEQQWQRAAQGDDNRIYPWGNDFDQTRCNIQESGINQPSPVTRYPSGASPYNVFDLSGNVWEWCLTTWQGDSTDLANDLHRVRRGGSWGFGQDLARIVYRSGLFPSERYYNIGFRLVCLLS
ncbi:MAG: formylglycine-generating enzyme family protein [Anaerolineae bacterium]|nr:formylglycine-generating enzyme family protein [Anaerolineae bacterium]